MKAPEVAVFDLGKVLVDFDYSIAIRRIAACCPDGKCDVRKLIDQSELLNRFETGRLDAAAFFAETKEASGFAGTQAEFGGMFSDIFTPIDPMIALQEELRRKGIRRYIFSNTNELAVAHIGRAFPFFSTFDGYIYSFKCGAMKPDPKFYEKVEEATGKKGSAILYIDDRPENIATGKALGWISILHENPATTRSAVGQYFEV